MSKTLRLTESEMISLVERIIKEQYDSKKLYSREYIVNRLKGGPRELKKYIKELISIDRDEWNKYYGYANKICPNFTEYETIWEYFLIINKNGFNQERFYHYYEKLQIAKEFCDISLNKEVNGAGEGISVRISAKLSETKIEQDLTLYEMLKDKMISVSRRYTPKPLWPDWMK